MAPRTRNWGLGVVLGLGLLSSVAAAASPVPRWSERFSGELDWASPRQSPAQIQQVYSRRHENGTSYLHASHDATSGKGAPPAVHYGHPFSERNVRLADACVLSWRWRVARHPKIADDAWKDLAASVYVVTRQPNVLSGGRGFKFGWLAKAGRPDQKQHGFLQIELRHEPAGNGWRSERVDLCALYEKEFGELGNEKILYVGVMTDADGTKSIAEADYADFVLSAR